jgi:hypothetical protein
MIDSCVLCLMAWVLGVFSAFMAYGWLEGQSDRYAGIAWRKELDTCVNWDLALQRARRQSDRLRLHEEAP